MTTLTTQEIKANLPKNLNITSSVPKKVRKKVGLASLQFLNGFEAFPESRFLFSRKTNIWGQDQDTFSLETPITAGSKKGKDEIKTIKRKMGVRLFAENEPESIKSFLDSAFYSLVPGLGAYARSLTEVKARIKGLPYELTPPPTTQSPLPHQDVRTRPVKISYSA